MINTEAGLGVNNARLRVYIENRPPLEQYQSIRIVKPLQYNDIATIAMQTGNHWRKIFNVYAKLIFELNPREYQTWQMLRDSDLLQAHSDECLLFTPFIKPISSIKCVHIIMGRTYAKKLFMDSQCLWLSKDFAINEAMNIIICPYFDYRQLSNVKVKELASLIERINQR